MDIPSLVPPPPRQKKSSDELLRRKKHERDKRAARLTATELEVKKQKKRESRLVAEAKWTPEQIAEKKERRRKYQAEWYERNKARANAKGSEWLARNRDKNKARLRKMYQEDRARFRNYSFKAKFGIDIVTYEQLRDKQSGVCAICKRPPKNRWLAVDHDHDTGVIRGLLCTRCNVGIGQLNDDVKLLQEAIAYLTFTRTPFVVPSQSGSAGYHPGSGSGTRSSATTLSTAPDAETALDDARTTP